MSVSKFNAEGYHDPTVFEALTNIEKEEQALRAFRPIVYICSPFSGDVEGNVKAAQRYSRFAVDIGYIPIAPHLLFPQFLNDKKLAERQLGLFFAAAFDAHADQFTDAVGVDRLERIVRQDAEVEIFRQKSADVVAAESEAHLR